MAETYHGITLLSTILLSLVFCGALCIAMYIGMEATEKKGQKQRNIRPRNKRERW